jgi:hypothetical protein
MVSNRYAENFPSFPKLAKRLGNAPASEKLCFRQLRYFLGSFPALVTNPFLTMNSLTALGIASIFALHCFIFRLERSASLTVKGNLGFLQPSSEQPVHVKGMDEHHVPPFGPSPSTITSFCI